MKYSTNCLNRERLEVIFSQSGEKQARKRKFSALKEVWSFLLSILTKGNELQVWQTSDRLGNTWWNAYDPANGRSTSHATDAEIRVWIEKRYYN